MLDWTHAKNNLDLPEELFEEIQALYKKTIKLPALKTTRQFLLCPVGLVGAGKTTVIKPLSEKLDFLRVSADEIRELLKEKGFNYSRARDLAYTVAEEFVAEGYNVAIDANCGRDDTQKKIKELENKYRVKVTWIHINPPEEFIINKLKNYKHTWLFGSGDEAVESYFKYKEKYGDFKNLNLPYVYTFDTSRNDLDKQIEEAAEIIRNE